MLLTAFLYIAMLLPQLGTAWTRYNAEEKISFQLPNKPEVSFQLEGDIPVTIYKTRDLHCVFGVVCSNFESKQELLAPEYRGRLVELLKSGSAPKEESGKITAEEYIQEDNPFVYEISYTCVRDKQQWTYIKRFIIQGDYLYQVSIGGKTRNTDDLKYESEIFFDSISFL